VNNKAKSVIKALESRRSDIDAIISIAKACLQSDLFQSYKKAYEQYERTVLKTLLEYPANDPEYKSVCLKYHAELRILRKLLDEVERDAEKEKYIKAATNGQ